MSNHQIFNNQYFDGMSFFNKLFPVVSINSCNIKGQLFKYTLLSRRSCFRAGTRYYVRGLDAEGHVANFVETEQILEYGTVKCSFVQVHFQYIILIYYFCCFNITILIF